jgi:hypothetical protein
MSTITIPKPQPHRLNQIANPLMKWLLHSPLQRLADKQTMLITVTGRRTGQRYTIPVNYVHDGRALLVTSQRCRNWWRNLRGGAPVTLFCRGQARKHWGNVVERGSAVAILLSRYLQQVPDQAHAFGVRLDGCKQPQADDVRQAAQKYIMIRLVPVS